LEIVTGFASQMQCIVIVFRVTNYFQLLFLIH